MCTHVAAWVINENMSGLRSVRQQLMTFRAGSPPFPANARVRWTL